MKKIRTESGVWIPATYKTNRYNMWKEKSKVDENDNESDSEEESLQTQKCKLIYDLISKNIESNHNICSTNFLCISIHSMHSLSLYINPIFFRI